MDPPESTLEASANNYSGTNFNHLYKTRGYKEESQANRRRKLLEHQKRNRSNAHDSSRLSLLAQCEEEDTPKSKPKNKNALNNYNTVKLYSNQLMFSEWMEELPENFEDDWFMVPCPVGIRVLLVASRGRTKAFTKRGRCIFDFQSALPGGSRSKQSDIHGYTILDCIFSELTETFYILDLLAWGKQPFVNCETEFRFFWLQGQLSERVELSEKNDKLNLYPFSLLSHYECSIETISNVLNNWPFFNNNTPKVDGLLFYHKNTSYTAGYTPTVLWLFSFMVPEIISRNIMIDDNYMKEKPADYENQKLFIEKFNEDQKKKKKGKSYLKSLVMETEGTVEETEDSPLLSDMEIT